MAPAAPNRSRMVLIRLYTRRLTLRFIAASRLVAGGAGCSLVTDFGIKHAAEVSDSLCTDGVD